MNLFDNVKQFLGMKTSIEKMSISDIDKEIIRFEEEENRLIKKVKKLEGQKEELFKQGSSKESQREKLIYVRKIKQFDQEAKIHDQKLNQLQKNVSFLSNIRWLKENEKAYKEQGVWSSLMNMDPVELEQWVMKQRTEIRAHGDQVDGLNDMVSSEDALFEGGNISEEDKALLSAMEQAQESGNVDESYEEMNELLKKKEKETE